MAIKNQSGFTLIELLVVISIIIFLITYGVLKINDSRMKARDAQRVANLKQLSSALELYYDKNGSYPTLTCLESPWWNCWGQPNWNCSTYPGSLKCLLVDGGFIGSMPRDPIFYDDGQACGAPSATRAFYYYSDGKSYFLCTNLESSSANKVSQANRSGCSDYCTYFIGNWSPLPNI